MEGKDRTGITRREMMRVIDCSAVKVEGEREDFQVFSLRTEEAWSKSGGSLHASVRLQVYWSAAQCSDYKAMLGIQCEELGESGVMIHTLCHAGWLQLRQKWKFLRT